MIFELARTCKNNEAIFKQNCFKKMFIAFKMTYSCCFSLREIVIL